MNRRRALNQPNYRIEFCRPSRGFAMIAVLWGVVILSVIALAVLRGSKTDAMLASNAVENAQAMALADAGVLRAVLGLSADEFDVRWRADGRTYEWSFAGGRVALTILDEAGKVDLNYAEAPLLKGLFHSLGVDGARAASLADAVEDFRDADDLKRLNGAEDRTYRVAGYPYEAKDAPFEHTSELRQVFGMTPELFAELAPLVTIYSQSPALDSWTATAAVMRAVPQLELDDLSQFLAARHETETEDELDALTLPLGAATGDFLDPESGGIAFTVRSEAHTGSGAVFVREAVILPGDGPDGQFAIAEWRQGQRQAPTNNLPNFDPN